MKVVIVGDANVGKTSIIHTLLHGSFNGETPSTIAAAFHKVTLDDEAKSYNIDIWVCRARLTRRTPPARRSTAPSSRRTSATRAARCSSTT